MPKLSAGRRSSAATPPCAPRPAITADLIARAIIAAAAVYGDSPVRAMTAKRGPTRRSLMPAARGVMAVTGLPYVRVSRIMGLANGNMARASSTDDERFGLAVQAAERAASYAAWRPEARASVVGGMADDAVAAPAAPTPRLAPKNRPAPVIPPRPAKPALPPLEVELRGAGQGVTPEDERHLDLVAGANGGKGFPVLALRA